MSTMTVSRRITLVEMRCGKCDITFAVPDYWKQERLEDGGQWYCPNGHCRVYRDSENDRLRKEAERLKANNTHLRDQRDAAERSKNATERSNRALRGAATRTKKRIGNGICPCCKRSFANVARHMDNKHPEYADADA